MEEMRGRDGIRTIKGTTSTELKSDVVPLMFNEVGLSEAAYCVAR